MKKKLAIITIIIAGSILWVLTALAVCLRGTQTLAFTDTVQEAGSGVTYVKHSRTPVDFLPVGNECEFEITVDGPDEIVPTISISLESSKAEPIFTKTAKNGTFKTGKLNVGNKKIFLNFDYEPLPELDENKDYAVRYTIELTSGNYALYNSIMLTLAAVCILPLALSIAYLISLNENNKKVLKRVVFADDAIYQYFSPEESPQEIKEQILQMLREKQTKQKEDEKEPASTKKRNTKSMPLLEIVQNEYERKRHLPDGTQVLREVSEEGRAKKRTRQETVEMLQKRYGIVNQTKREEDVSHV